MPPRSIVFDFNGTLSDDEPILYAVYAELFAEHGRPLTEQAYFEELAGNTEEEIILRWLGRADEELVRARIDRYVERARDGSTVTEDVRAAVRLAAARVPVGVVSAATREEIDAVLGAAGLADLFTIVVSSEDVTRGKPDPQPYELAVARLGLPAADVTAFEDTEAGVASAKVAGLHVVGVTRTLGAERLELADRLVPSIDATTVAELLA
ncbi:MAG TPA: HAD family phosphatase [Gaiellaceae bacterium]|nr:HAD family phosphatase [Gaiellaceae bacterium]